MHKGGLVTQLKQAGLMAALLVAIILGILAFHYHGESVSAAEKVSQLQSDNALQSATIATQGFQFQKYNEIAANAAHYSTNIKGKAQEREIEYRTILKNNPTCNLLVPAGVADRLLEYTNSLRASAMHPDTIKPDRTDSGTAAAFSITYCQAVLWIDPLLAAIDQANNQLAGIRQIESTRASQ
jgi:hypothetical protein